ncbi:hypothetical protein L2E82_13333 [Cichorium intybus]|uniref:Uncharacterized protein n=1 Tax=Cichorium intybus TaxID=13427 RepID=A0ACB9EXM8_CICIN|nr:hypothetical protein L2E82_13333 [Cichorium intybus]
MIEELTRVNFRLWQRCTTSFQNIASHSNLSHRLPSVIHLDSVVLRTIHHLLSICFGPIEVFHGRVLSPCPSTPLWIYNEPIPTDPFHQMMLLLSAIVVFVIVLAKYIAKTILHSNYFKIYGFMDLDMLEVGNFNLIYPKVQRMEIGIQDKELGSIESFQSKTVVGIISSKALKFLGPELDAMKDVADAYSKRSLKLFETALQDFKAQLDEDPIVHRHLSSLYDTLLEQNLCSSSIQCIIIRNPILLTTKAPAPPLSYWIVTIIVALLQILHHQSNPIGASPGPESIADHMYIASEILLQRLLWLNLISFPSSSRCIKMAIVHDIVEVIVGDITPSDGIPKLEKSRMEKEALDHMSKLLGGGPRAEEIYELWMEYEENSTNEAKVVKDFDKVEMILQALECEKDKFSGVSIGGSV